MRDRLIAFLLVLAPFSIWAVHTHHDRCTPINWEVCR